MSNRKIVATQQHNVYCDCLPDFEKDEITVKAIPHPSLQLLINQLVRKRPRWHYILKGHSGSGFIRSSMWITEDGEQLGEVDIEKHWRTNDITYEIDNPRIRNSRQRGGGAKTTKLPVAVKLIINNFAMKTIDELLQAAENSTKTAVSRGYSKAQSNLTSVVYTLRDELFNLVANNPTIKQQIIFSDEAKNERFDRLPNLYAEEQVARTMYDKYQQNDGNIVMMRGDKLWVCAVNDLTNHISYTYETAPKHIILAVAMLKVAGEGVVIDGIGVRADAEHFYVVNPQVHDE